MVGGRPAEGGGLSAHMLPALYAHLVYICKQMGIQLHTSLAALTQPLLPTHARERWHSCTHALLHNLPTCEQTIDQLHTRLTAKIPYASMTSLLVTCIRSVAAGRHGVWQLVDTTMRAPRCRLPLAGLGTLLMQGHAFKDVTWPPNAARTSRATLHDLSCSQVSLQQHYMNREAA